MNTPDQKEQKHWRDETDVEALRLIIFGLEFENEALLIENRAYLEWDEESIAALRSQLEAAIGGRNDLHEAQHRAGVEMTWEPIDDLLTRLSCFLDALGTAQHRIKQLEAKEKELEARLKELGKTGKNL